MENTCSQSHEPIKVVLRKEKKLQSITGSRKAVLWWTVWVKEYVNSSWTGRSGELEPLSTPRSLGPADRLLDKKPRIMWAGFNIPTRNNNLQTQAQAQCKAEAPTPLHLILCMAWDAKSHLLLEIAVIGSLHRHSTVSFHNCVPGVNRVSFGQDRWRPAHFRWTVFLEKKEPNLVSFITS